MNAVAPGLRAHVQHGISRAGRFAKEDLIVAQQAERESVNQRIKRIGIVKCDFAADGGHAESVSVMRDAGHDSGQQRSVPPSMLRMIERAKTQTIQRRNRAGPHGENIAQDPADTGGRSLKRFDE